MLTPWRELLALGNANGTCRTASHQGGTEVPWPAVPRDCPRCAPTRRRPGSGSRHRQTPLIWLFSSGASSPGLRWKVGWFSDQGDVMPDDNTHAIDDTPKLRAKFPRLGILLDSLESVWVAVRGQGTLVGGSSPEKLTEQVEAAARARPGRVRATGSRRGVPAAGAGGVSGCGRRDCDVSRSLLRP